MELGSVQGRSLPGRKRALQCQQYNTYFFLPSYETILIELTKLEKPTCPQGYLSNAYACKTLFAASKGILLPGDIPSTPTDKIQSRPIILVFSNGQFLMRGNKISTQIASDHVQQTHPCLPKMAYAQSPPYHVCRKAHNLNLLFHQIM